MKRIVFIEPNPMRRVKPRAKFPKQEHKITNIDHQKTDPYHDQISIQSILEFHMITNI